MPTPRLVIPTSFPVTESAPFGGPRVLAGTANGPKPDPRILGSIAAGLGANIAVQDNTRQNGK
jgi:hypothetical protein